jgi:hypothetical protein
VPQTMWELVPLPPPSVQEVALERELTGPAVLALPPVALPHVVVSVVESAVLWWPRQQQPRCAGWLP